MNKLCLIMSGTCKANLKNCNLNGKRVLLRADYNVPMVDGVVTDVTRIRATIDTIKEILKHDPAKLAICSHLGRPEGRRNMKYSLSPVVAELQNLLQMNITFIEDCIGSKVEEFLLAEDPNMKVCLMENLRFHAEEEGKGLDDDGSPVKPSKEEIGDFCSKLFSPFDLVVNDAFGTAHRPHASMVGGSKPRIAGLLLQRELEFFRIALETPKRPFVAILGGAKVQDKIQLINNLIDKVDDIIIGGGMAYTFMKVLHNMEIGNSIFDSSGAKVVDTIMKKAIEKGVNLHLPVDFVCADKFSNDAHSKVVKKSAGISPGYEGLDIGPETVELFKSVIAKSGTILWNGPQGVFEFENFAKGSIGILEAVTHATSGGAISIVGGGDTASLVEGQRKAHSISHVSTGGGASLELLEGKILPGVAALDDE